MYEIALTVAACLRSGTRVDVAWVVARLSRDGALHANEVALINFLKSRRADLQRRLWPILDLAA